MYENWEKKELLLEILGQERSDVLQECFSIFFKSKRWKCISKGAIKLAILAKGFEKSLIYPFFTWQIFRPEPHCEWVSYFVVEQHHRRGTPVNLIEFGLSAGHSAN